MESMVTETLLLPYTENILTIYMYMCQSVIVFLIVEHGVGRVVVIWK